MPRLIDTTSVAVTQGGSRPTSCATSGVTINGSLTPGNGSFKPSYATNGAFSPHSTMNGTPTPSPPALSSPPTNTPTSSSQSDSTVANSGSGGLSSKETQKLITKVRRFLKTLQQFASDISTDVGDKSGAVSVEDFHSSLQEVTHFPLRPFVLPFLRSHLPLLTRELHGHARRANMSMTQYVTSHEAVLLEAVAGEPTDFFSSEVTNGKRRHEGMVEKTRKALTMLQEREGGTSSRIQSSVGILSLDNGRGRAELESELRRHANEILTQTVRSAEERISELKRKAEEAVNEVRRAAVAEVQRAVGAAESRAQELITAERAKTEILLRDFGRPRETNEQRLDSQQSCWNCGRKAHETCSGCNVARYCGSFCQHKDWDLHHKVCSPVLASSASAVISGKKFNKSLEPVTKVE